MRTSLPLLDRHQTGKDQHKLGSNIVHKLRQYFAHSFWIPSFFFQNYMYGFQMKQSEYKLVVVSGILFLN